MDGVGRQATIVQLDGSPGAAGFAPAAPFPERSAIRAANAQGRSLHRSRTVAGPDDKGRPGVRFGHLRHGRGQGQRG